MRYYKFIEHFHVTGYYGKLDLDWENLQIWDWLYLSDQRHKNIMESLVWIKVITSIRVHNFSFVIEYIHLLRRVKNLFFSLRKNHISETKNNFIIHSYQTYFKWLFTTCLYICYIIAYKFMILKYKQKFSSQFKLKYISNVLKTYISS